MRDRATKEAGLEPASPTPETARNRHGVSRDCRAPASRSKRCRNVCVWRCELDARIVDRTSNRADDVSASYRRDSGLSFVVSDVVRRRPAACHRGADGGRLATLAAIPAIRRQHRGGDPAPDAQRDAHRGGCRASDPVAGDRGHANRGEHRRQLENPPSVSSPLTLLLEPPAIACGGGFTSARSRRGSRFTLVRAGASSRQLREGGRDQPPPPPHRPRPA
jgi:hypothetical protein